MDYSHLRGEYELSSCDPRSPGVPKHSAEPWLWLLPGVREGHRQRMAARQYLGKRPRGLGLEYLRAVQVDSCTDADQDQAHPASLRIAGRASRLQIAGLRDAAGSDRPPKFSPRRAA